MLKLFIIPIIITCISFYIFEVPMLLSKVSFIISMSLGIFFMVIDFFFKKSLKNSADLGNALCADLLKKILENPQLQILNKVYYSLLGASIIAFILDYTLLYFLYFWAYMITLIAYLKYSTDLFPDDFDSSKYL